MTQAVQPAPVPLSWGHNSLEGQEQLPDGRIVPVKLISLNLGTPVGAFQFIMKVDDFERLLEDGTKALAQAKTGIRQATLADLPDAKAIDLSQLRHRNGN
jgi:hypothetical protein